MRKNIESLVEMLVRNQAEKNAEKLQEIVSSNCKKANKNTDIKLSKTIK